MQFKFILIGFVLILFKLNKRKRFSFRKYSAFFSAAAVAAAAICLLCVRCLFGRFNSHQMFNITIVTLIYVSRGI